MLLQQETCKWDTLGTATLASQGAVETSMFSIHYVNIYMRKKMLEINTKKTQYMCETGGTCKPVNL